jgi:hypothetical protein
VHIFTAFLFALFVLVGGRKLFYDTIILYTKLAVSSILSAYFFFGKLKKFSFLAGFLALPLTFFLFCGRIMVRMGACGGVGSSRGLLAELD